MSISDWSSDVCSSDLRAAVECGVEAEAIRRLARWYADARPALIAVGNGLERNRNGGNGVRAILALPVLGGKWGVAGGGAVAKVGAIVPKTPASDRKTVGEGKGGSVGVAHRGCRI